MSESQSETTVEFDRSAIEAIEDPMARLRVIMKRLLGPGGCPWDREQTHQTLKQYMIEEAHEVCEAIDRGSDDELCEELGDVALQVVFHSALAERDGRFKLEQVYEAICAKLIDRHPHVFGDVRADDAEAVLANWEQLKAEEKQRKAESRSSGPVSILADVPASLPGLQRARRLQEKASRVGFDWPDRTGAIEKVKEELEEFVREVQEGSEERAAEELGDLLFSLVNVSRFLNLLPEEALGRSCKKFEQRFHAIEDEARRRGVDLSGMSLEEMDAIWEQAKRLE